MLLSIVLVLLAAMANAAASVLQRKAARNEPDDDSASSAWRMSWSLAHKPVWFGGIAAIIVGFLLQAGALATGPIALVQPILVLELAFTLILAAVVFHNRLHLREWTAIGGMTAGLALMLYCLQPAGGDPRATPTAVSVLAIAVTLAVAGGFLALAQRGGHSRRAAFLGIATGVGFGLTATLIAAITRAYAVAGLGGVFTAWQTYLLIAIGPFFFLTLQKTMQAGSLVASQPALTLANPIVAVGFGIAVFGEEVRGGGWIAGDLIGAAVICACTVLLARSPLLHDTGERAKGAGSPPG